MDGWDGMAISNTTSAKSRAPYGAKKKRKKKVKNSFSDNFEASGLPHGSFEALWARVKWEYLKSDENFQNWGPSPL